MSVQRQNPDGSYSPAEPMGWQEEHGWLARLIFWLRRIEHCNDAAERLPSGHSGRFLPGETSDWTL